MGDKSYIGVNAAAIASFTTKYLVGQYLRNMTFWYIKRYTELQASTVRKS